MSVGVFARDVCVRKRWERWMRDVMGHVVREGGVESSCGQRIEGVATGILVLGVFLLVLQASTKEGLGRVTLVDLRASHPEVSTIPFLALDPHTLEPPTPRSRPSLLSNRPSHLGADICVE